jgi:hypothetical protein
VVWHRLSTREGKKPPSGPYEGVPAHLMGPVVNWIVALFPGRGYAGIQNAETLRHIATMNEIAIKPGADDYEVFQTVLGRCVNDEELCLDVVDCLLQFRDNFGPAVVEELSVPLTVGRSIWDTAPDGRSLVRRTDPTAAEQFKSAVAPNDVASEELAHAWDKIYGRHPDSSDAWDHAIKAVEAVLIPIVCPRKDKANLGSVAGVLQATPHSWKLAFDNGGTGGVGTLEAMLRLMWPNPDRHQDGTVKRKPSRGEAEAVVHLAVTIVQWARSGGLVKR